MVNGEAWRRVVPQPHDNAPLSGGPSWSRSARYQMLFEIGRAVRSADSRLERVVARILADYAAEPDLLAGLTVNPSPQRYTRHLLDAGSGYCVLAIVWLPGQMSSVHSHRAWCALGIHQGALTEMTFERADPLRHPATLRLAGAGQLHAGATSHGPANEPRAHRIANLGVEPAISIHAYGAAFDRLDAELNQVWAE